ncbi:MAG: SfnB family sulfur acquisition oxidoreductase [Nitriliruptorales bacterium]|nr:SfnB family sulfur acquisition oxidoreductase [Nitriliruptorales bacterium]
MSEPASDLLDVARVYAEKLRGGAAERDRERPYPYAEMDELRDSLLIRMRVPVEFGGIEVSYREFTQVLKELARGDSSVAQVFGTHLSGVDTIAFAADAAVRETLYRKIVDDRCLLTNSWSESTGKHPLDWSTKLTAADGPDRFRLSGEKYYSTGCQSAQILVVGALGDGHTFPGACLAFAPAKAAGVEIIDDWRGFGQRTTASGTTRFTDVEIPDGWVVDMSDAMPDTSLYSVMFQLIFGSIYTGIAQAALDDTVDFVQRRTRAWMDSGVEQASKDPYTLQRAGDMQVAAHAAEMLVYRAADAADASQRSPSAHSRGLASVATAEAKVASTDVALECAAMALQLCGSRGVDEKHGLDRHWRNARTLTLHDPVDYKRRLVGDFVLNGQLPPVTGFS